MRIFLFLLMGLMVMMVGTVSAQTVGDWCLPCSPVQVTCDCSPSQVQCDCPIQSEIQCNCQCDCETTVLPGLWEVVIQGVLQCGKMTVIGEGFLLERGEGVPMLFKWNVLKKAKQVESCP